LLDIGVIRALQSPRILRDCAPNILTVDDLTGSNRPCARNVEPLVAFSDAASIHATSLAFAKITFDSVASKRLLPFCNIFENIWYRNKVKPKPLGTHSVHPLPKRRVVDTNFLYVGSDVRTLFVRTKLTIDR
jgi:hypothetical protein